MLREPVIYLVPEMFCILYYTYTFGYMKNMVPSLSVINSMFDCSITDYGATTWWGSYPTSGDVQVSKLVFQIALRIFGFKQNAFIYRA